MKLEQRPRPAAIVSLVALAVVLAVTLAACGQTTPSVAPASPSLAVSVSAAPSANPAPTASPIPSPTPVVTPSPVADCVVTSQTGQLPSDRFTDLKVATSATADRLTFVFGNASLNGGPPPQGKLDAARPPYTQAGSGATIAVTGAHVVQIRFSGMSLQNDVGQETYTGPAELKPAFPALRHAVLFDASEGIIGWYVGYDGPGCVTLGREGANVTVTISHP
jgi:hypothetical protein